ncbi:hypothetical protein OPV22_001851 [Ensete ventricosum]|uniref:Uncharacterized protein n=1 Tax=Ensete ventricosum TaxID=4639 RepID=A0AAV8RWK0_ENSVE|nr:hypothetical protein OPV22_001851 [Ensete ventricosum]
MADQLLGRRILVNVTVICMVMYVNVVVPVHAVGGLHVSLGLIDHGRHASPSAVRAVKVSGGHSIQHQRRDRGDHRSEPSKRKLLPRTPTETRGGEAVESVGEDVDETGGENDTGSERLDDEEGILFGVKSGPPFA